MVRRYASEQTLRRCTELMFEVPSSVTPPTAEKARRRETGQ